MTPRDQPEQQAPPVQRLRVRYAKRGRLRFTSHRDFSRAFERALVRARVPMAYSSGFHPHPRISYAGAAPTGSASEAEYLEIGLAQVVPPDDVRAALDDSLPPGLDVLEVVDVAEAAPGSLADRLTGSRWAVDVTGPERPDVERAVSAFLDADDVPVERMTKKGLRTFDARAAVVALSVPPADGDGSGDGPGGAVRVDLLLRHTVPAVRPDDVLTGLARVGGLDTTLPPLLTRLEQGVLVEPSDDEGAPDVAQVLDPLRRE